jgi:NAD(P)-dependent dehydrogenase (short-subunit alcohol dehydrogenase family)
LKNIGLCKVWIKLREECAIWIRAELGEIDLVVQCAANVINKPSSLEFTEEDWDNLVNVTAKGLFFVMQEVVKQSMQTRGGSIVNMAAMAGIRGMSPPLCNAIYSAAKGAVISLSRQGSVEWAKFGVRVNAMAPGGVSVFDRSLPPFMFPMVPLQRFCTPQEVAAGVLFLLSDKAAATMGQVMVIDGGSSVQGY